MKDKNGLLDYSGNIIKCFKCKKPIKSEEGYGFGDGKFWCEKCCLELDHKRGKTYDISRKNKRRNLSQRIL